MGNPEEPEYQRFEGICRECGAPVTYSNSVKLHPSKVTCEKCRPRTKDDKSIYRVLTQIRQHGTPCFLADSLTIPALDSAVKGSG